LRTTELAYAESHLARLRAGRPESIETSSFHLDALRDLKRIYATIAGREHSAQTAFPLLEDNFPVFDR
jgi:phosphate:Na+ symporter